MRSEHPFHSSWRGACALLFSLALALSLAACGGGGGESGGSAKPTPTAPSNPSGGGVRLEASCSGCGALDANNYAGAGTGVWQGVNASQVPVDVPIAIAGLGGQTVTLVFTNESAGAQAMPGLVSRSLVQRGASKAFATSEAEVHDHNEAISEFNRSGFAKLIAEASKYGAASAKSMAVPSLAHTSHTSHTPGNQRQVFLDDGSQRTVELATQKATGDGTMVNVWVEVGELGAARVTTTLADRMRDSFANAGGIYDMLVRTGGPLWGSHSQSVLLDAAGRPVDIFFVNFDHNQQAYGKIGFFWGLNNFKTGVGLLAQSNESLALFMDSETLYLAGEPGVKLIATAIAHEAMHMQNFYRRAVKMGDGHTFDTWLEEMTALMMEDWASLNIDPSHNAVRDSRYGSFLGYRGTGSYNCALTVWTPMAAECESYALTASFGGYLNRQLGLDFYKALLHNPGATNSSGTLDAAIKSVRPGSGVGQELRRFNATSAGLIPLGASLAEYSLPARSEGGFSLPAIDPPSVSGGHRTMPQSVPSEIRGLASFPVARQGVVGTFSETVRVPPGTTLSVVIN